MQNRPPSGSPLPSAPDPSLADPAGTGASSSVAREREGAELDRLVQDLVAGARAGRPEGAGAVAAAIARPGRQPLIRMAGRTIAFAADGSPLPPEHPGAHPVTERTLFDLASVTKVVTALVAATFLDEGALDLEASAVSLLGAAAVPDPRITVRMLMTHTSGLPPVMDLWRQEGTRAERLDAIGRARLIAEPGTQHAYSCIGFITLGRILERIGGQSLPELARDRVLIPGGARTAAWSPIPEPEQAAATECTSDPPRGLVQGEVHDETAWSIGGAGNAGLFGTIGDALAIGGILAGTAAGPQLSTASRALLSTDQLGEAVPTGAPWRQGLGLRVGQVLPDGSLLAEVIGHPGFTGTAIWADPRTGTTAALLTNRVHPDRERFGVQHAREELARLAFAADSTLLAPDEAARRAARP